MAATKAEEEFCRFLSENGYHPRSSTHGDRLCELVLADLMARCSDFREGAARGKLVYKQNHTVNPGTPSSWNVDLVVGPPASSTPPPSAEGLPAKAEPSDIWIAIDAKSVMTEHGKARRNRQRDLNAFHDILHKKNPKAVVGGLMVLNVAPQFRSPLRPKVTTHRNIERLVAETVEMMADIPRSPSPEEADGLDALGVIVVDFTNTEGSKCSLVTSAPAPQSGDRTHYESFLLDLCQAYKVRFGRL